MAFAQKTATVAVDSVRTIPNPEQRSPLLRELHDRRHALQVRLSAAQREESETFRRVATGEAASVKSQNAAVIELLGDGPADVRDDHQRLRDVQQEIKDFEQALREIGHRIDSEAARISREIASEFRVPYSAKVTVLARAIAAAASAQAELTEFTDAFDRAGVTWASTLRPMSANDLVGKDVVAPWLADAVRNDFISASELP